MQQCYCGAEGCRGAIGINKKIELANVVKKKRGGGGGGARFVMADSKDKEAEFKGLASWVLLPYWELLVEFPMIWRERSMARDGRVFLIRNVARVYCQFYGADMARRNFIGEGKGMIRERWSGGGKGIAGVLKGLWEKVGCDQPSGFVGMVLEEGQDENEVPRDGKGKIVEVMELEPRAVVSEL
jgi:hypothetical protein